MKKRTKILLCTAAVLAAAGVGAAAWQWNNLSALRYGMTMDQETLNQKIEENRTVLNEAMDRYQLEQYEIPEEQISRLTDGSLTPLEAARELLEQEEQKKTESSAGGDTAAASSAPAEQLSGEEQEIRQLIAAMYVLQATYEGKVEAVAQAAIDEYVAGEHTPEHKTKVVYDRVQELLDMEKECDAQVAEITARLRQLLKATGQSDDLARQVEQTYQQEKSLKKAAYLNKFQNG
ncbi:hypothetical protein [Dysosmobacter sp.]|uniref:hypothetical protein n=1 Tax=Dysosmobacter sp. TaxID=2591382 RepID=UPI002A8CC284|nr:hypothetical protein [Dysosmobacter sp.]MDY3281426.1 hypothetical protein [Dysosmobacter sp.]